MAILLALGGFFADLAGLFTLAALITFGGAYAVLPFVADQAVNRFAWLTPDDMVAGLALGETTPGPLIMVNTFVGYVAGNRELGGVPGGLVGAAIATACTFAPSFVFIVNGAPYVERITHIRLLAEALHGVTIAVVGVIGALAVFLGRHVLLVDGAVEWPLVALAVIALVALWRFRVSPLRVIAACAADRRGRRRLIEREPPARRRRQSRPSPVASHRAHSGPSSSIASAS